MTLNSGDLAAAEPLLTQAEAIDLELGSKLHIGLNGMNLGILALRRGDHETSIRRHQRSLQLFRELGDETHSAYALINLGNVMIRSGQPAQAANAYADARNHAIAAGNIPLTASSEYELAGMANADGDLDRARAWLSQSIQNYLEVNDENGVATCLEAFAEISARTGQAELGAQLLGAAGVLRSSAGPPSTPAEPGSENARATVRAALDDAVFAERYAEGRLIGRADAVALALGATS
jgi:tetratricopeptide (TPR) repeat protein